MDISDKFLKEVLGINEKLGTGTPLDIILEKGIPKDKIGIKNITSLVYLNKFKK